MIALTTIGLSFLAMAFFHRNWADNVLDYGVSLQGLGFPNESRFEYFDKGFQELVRGCGIRLYQFFVSLGITFLACGRNQNPDWEDKWTKLYQLYVFNECFDFKHVDSSTSQQDKIQYEGSFRMQTKSIRRIFNNFWGKKS